MNLKSIFSVFKLSIYIIFLILSLSSCSEYMEDNKDSRKLYRVAYVIDGDTIKIEYQGRLESVRFIGVDTPETGQRFGSQATAYTKSLLNGRSVYLTFSGARRDKYGRLLAYVYRSDGLFVNLKIICKGYGRTYGFSFKHRNLFLSCERQAQNARRGMWR